MARQVEHDSLRNVQVAVVGRGRAVLRERDGSALVQQILERLPGERRPEADLAACEQDRLQVRVVAGEARKVARRRAVGDGEGVDVGGLGLDLDAEGGARREAGDGDGRPLVQEDVARLAEGVGVAGDDGGAGYPERGAFAHVHAAAAVAVPGSSGGYPEARCCGFGAAFVAGDRAAVHLEHAAPTHEDAAAGVAGVARDQAAVHREDAALGHGHAAAAARDGTRALDAVREREMPAGAHEEHRELAVARERASGEVEHDVVRDRQGVVVGHRGAAVLEREDAALEQPELELPPGRDGRREEDFAIRLLQAENGIVAEEEPPVARRRVGRDGDRL